MPKIFLSKRQRSVFSLYMIHMNTLKESWIFTMRGIYAFSLKLSNKNVIHTKEPYQWSSLLILLLLNTVGRHSITSQIWYLDSSNTGFPSGLQFVVHQESPVSKSFMVMNQSNTIVQIKKVVDLRCKTCGGQKEKKYR